MPVKHLALAVALASLSCGKSSGSGADGAGSGIGGNGTGTTVTSLLGAWDGQYGLQNTNNSALLTDVHPAHAEFSSNNANNDDTSGNFKITLTDAISNGAAVYGSFVNFGAAPANLQLTITQSNISTIGLTSAYSVQLAYILEGSFLKLYNSQVTLNLTPEGPNGPPTAPSTGTSTSVSTGTGTGSLTGSTADPNIYGRWACTDNLGNNWTLNLQTNNSFTIDVVASGVQGDIQLDGTAAIVTGQGNQDADAALAVSQSNVAAYNGMHLKAKNGGSNTDMTLTRLNADGSANETFPCSKTSS